MSTDRTITKEDLDPDTREFVQELCDRVQGHGANVEGDAVDDAHTSSFDSIFGE